MPLSKPIFNLSTINPEHGIINTEKRQDPFDNIFQQAMGKEPFVSFSRAGDNHLHLFQLLHALEQQGTNKLSKGSKPPNGIDGKYRTQELRTDFAGWPLSLPPKLQMQKCDKCSREFCSPINYRRHIRIHRRSLHIDKDSSKIREYLASFWDKLSLEQAIEIISFKNAVLEEVPGSSIIKTLASFVRKPAFISLPQFYVKAGASILDIIQSRPSKLPIFSKDLFAILDDASEQTFLCAGTAANMQRFVFDGEAAKIGLELRNIVACTSFLIEQKLVAAWLADKDAEALRCQKLLVEEEEAAQKRQAELSEKRRLKKLRHKEQKQKEHGDDDGTTDDTDVLLGPVNDSSTPGERPASPVPAVPDPECGLLSCESVCPLEPSITTHADDLSNAVSTMDITDKPESEVMHLDNQNGDKSGSHATDQKSTHVFEKQHFNTHVRQTVRHLRYLPNGFNSGLGPHCSSVASQKFGGFKDQKIASKQKVWAVKSNMEKNTDMVDKGRVGVDEKMQESNKCEVLIGSISVAISECKGLGKDGIDIAVPVPANGQDCNDQKQTADQQATNRNPAIDKRGDPDCGQACMNQPKLKLWRPVGVAARGREEATHSIVDKTVGSSCDQWKESTDCALGKMADGSEAKESCNILAEIEREVCDACTSSLDNESAKVDAVKDAGLMLFSFRDAELFLNQRWKEAISGDHTTIVTSQDAEMSFISVNPQIASAEPIISVGSAVEPEPVERIEDFNREGRTVLANTENRMTGATNHRGLDGVLKLQSQTKSVGKTNRLKYIPKQKNMHR